MKPNIRPAESLPPVSPLAHVPPPGEDAGGETTQLLATILEGRWVIIATTILGVAVGSLYGFVATPIYRSDALLQVEEQSDGLGRLKGKSESLLAEVSAGTDVELLRSRMMAERVITALGLDIVAEPVHLPGIGAAMARRWTASSPAAPFMGLSSYAWGGESIKVESFAVPEGLLNTHFVLVAGSEGTYVVTDPAGQEVLKGKVGETAVSNPGRPAVELHVSELRARSGTRFRLQKLGRIAAIANFQQSLSVTSKGGDTGMILLEMQGKNQTVVRASLNELMKAYVRQNVDRKTEETESTLKFIRSQLPVQKANLEEAEVRLNSYRQRIGKVNLSIEAQAIVSKSSSLEARITEMSLSRSQLRERYTASHPIITGLDKNIHQLQTQLNALEEQAKVLPEQELNSVRIVRDVSVANELYMLLLNKAQELSVAKSGTIGNVRIIDEAIVHPSPISPKTASALLIAILLGLAGGIGIVLLRKSMNAGVEDPEELEQVLNLPVYASLPFSAKQAEMIKRAQGKRETWQPLARLDAADLAMESLRSLRTSIQFSLASATNNVILIGGSRPGVGKSFVSVNLSHVLADTGKRILLIDADLRKGQLHRYFGQKREGGLSELISNQSLIESSIKKTEVPNLFFLSSGRIPPNPSELLSGDAFLKTIDTLSRQYDLVVMDAPPVLAVTDAALLARAAGLNLLVVKSGVHPMREIALAVSRLQQSGVKTNGFVFNAVPLSDRIYGYGKYRYHYQYDYR